MKIIQDIRVFMGTIDNIDGNPLPKSFATKEMNIIIKRVVMKLKEANFSLGDFDHLYINLTICDIDNKIMLSKRTIDKYHPFYRYYDYHLEKCEIDKLALDLKGEILLHLVEDVLMTYFADTIEKEKIIKNAITEARDGENMLMKYKEKSNTIMHVIIYLRLFNDGYYHPLMVIREKNGEEHIEELEPTIDLGIINEISVSNKRITIKPKKTSLYKTVVPYVYDISQNERILLWK